MLDDLFEFEFEDDEQAKKDVIVQSIILIIKGIFTTGALITTIVRFTKHGNEGVFYLGLAFLFTAAACFVYKLVIYIVKLFVLSIALIPIPIVHIFAALLVVLTVIYLIPAAFAVVSLIESAFHYTAARKYLKGDYI